MVADRMDSEPEDSEAFVKMLEKMKGYRCRICEIYIDNHPRMVYYN